MKLLINITPAKQLDWNKLATLVKNIQSQNFSNVSLNLQLPPHQQLSETQQAAAVTWSLSCTDRPTTPVDYVLNLWDTDDLLPTALRQWDQLVAQHPDSLVSLATFDSRSALPEQVDAYLQHHSASNLSAVYTQLTDQALSLETLWGIQSYSIQTNLQNQALLPERLKVTGLLLPSALLNAEMPLNSLSQALHVLQQTPDVVRLHVPTLATQSLLTSQPQEAFAQLMALADAPLDITWQPVITTFVQTQLNHLLRSATRYNLSPTAHTKLLRQIKQHHFNMRFWSRLALLNHLSPRIAHWLFY